MAATLEGMNISYWEVSQFTDRHAGPAPDPDALLQGMRILHDDSYQFF